MPSHRDTMLRRSLLNALKHLHDAKERGESEIYLTYCRFKVDEIKAAIERESEKARKAS